MLIKKIIPTWENTCADLDFLFGKKIGSIPPHMLSKGATIERVQIPSIEGHDGGMFIRSPLR